jgi:hypothetical protein
METLSLSKLQNKNVFATNGLENEDVVKSIMSAYLHEVLPVIDKFYNAVVYNDYKLLPVLSARLRPYFQALDICTDPLEAMERTEELANDHRSIQRLYFKVKSLCEGGIDIVRSTMVRIETRNLANQEIENVKFTISNHPVEG